MVGRLLERLPQVDWGQVHRLADQVAGRDGEQAFEIATTAVFDWLARRVRSGEGEPGPAAPRRLAPYAEVWEKIAADARETDALNLDKRPLIPGPLRRSRGGGARRVRMTSLSPKSGS